MGHVPPRGEIKVKGERAKNEFVGPSAFQGEEMATEENLEELTETQEAVVL